MWVQGREYVALGPAVVEAEQQTLVYIQDSCLGRASYGDLAEDQTNYQVQRLIWRQKTKKVHGTHPEKDMAVPAWHIQLASFVAIHFAVHFFWFDDSHFEIARSSDLQRDNVSTQLSSKPSVQAFSHHP